MQIELDGRIFEIPPAYVQQLAEECWAKFEDLYTCKIDDAVKAALMALSRGLLVKQELSARKLYGKEIARSLRPPPREDPTLWMARKLLPAIEMSLNHAIITCETNGDTVTNFHVKLPDTGQAGGQVDSPRGVGMWEDNGTQVS